MKYYLYTYNAHAINDVTNYTATFVAGVPVLPSTDPILIERSENWPVFAGKALPGHEITLKVHINGAASNVAAKREELKAWFATDDQSLRKLIITDSDNANKQWYLMVTPTDFVSNWRENTITLSVPDPYWRAETVTTVNWTVTASGQTQAVTPVGNAASKPTITVTPNNAKTGGYSYKRLVTIFNASDAALVDYPVELTGGWNTSTEVGAGRMQADGDDLRVEIDDQEVDRWITGINTASSKVWVNISLAKPQTLTLGAATGTGAITTLSFRRTNANRNALKALPKNFILLIESEYFLCSTPVANKYQCTVDGRAALGSSAANHADGTSCTWMQRKIWIFYGNSSATAPVVDDAKKPILDLTNSTNTSWVYTDFADEAGLRTAAWKPAVTTLASDVSSSVSNRATSDVYTATQIAEADPASVAGTVVAAFEKAGAWKSDTASVEWRLYQPCGVTTIASASGSKYRYTTAWASKAAIQRSGGGNSWTDVNAQAAPASANTWTSWSISSTALGATNKYLRFLLSGTIKGSASNRYAYEVDAITLTLDSTKTPAVTFGAQQANYTLDAVLTNNTTGDALILRYLMATGQSLVINCEDKSVTHSSGANARAALTTNTRRLAWLDLQPGANTLQFDDVGTANVTVSIVYRDRNS